MNLVLGGLVEDDSVLKKTKSTKTQATEPAGMLCSPDEKTVTVIRYDD